jgi:hypothetical protein
VPTCPATRSLGLPCRSCQNPAPCQLHSVFLRTGFLVGLVGAKASVDAYEPSDLVRSVCRSVDRSFSTSGCIQKLPERLSDSLSSNLTIRLGLLCPSL